ncbi:endonuclease-8 [Arthrobacter stackebrandtii]|uniref:DNA-(apurinic or apyrimidinic site) lyase n=1 Tax=Arthrobacter stackebrandtii TaxID=272161 RepID=A0ABS4Z0E1_9MICC|nr:DNA glycosylase [Arthrobacter stackebrandtii]MBP2414285.1 endonuclease-8 [Arthrobacter stackebrandtii]PYH01818.1 formamidopyrimidine-DNA glycosylase [Arthrobacter stackebrandtii]
MPEGHSVHRLARQFNDVFGGASLAVSSPQGKFAAGAALVDGIVLERAEAHGKQMFLYFSQDHVMRVHLGLYGAWDFGGDSTFTGASSIGAPRRIGEQEVAADTGLGGGGGGDYTGPPEPKGAVRVRLVSAHGWADLRGPTACEVITPDEAAAVRRKLGPDPLNNAPGDAEEFSRRIRKSSTSIALALMKQDVLAGVGNVYRAEVLFRLGLDPMLPGRSLQAEEAAALWGDIARTMADGVRDGRIITTELADRSSGIGAEVGHALAPAGQPETGDAAGGRCRTANKDVPVEDAHYVYKREGLPCRHCGTEVAMKDLGGRKLYWCPSCQGD